MTLYGYVDVTGAYAGALGGDESIPDGASDEDETFAFGCRIGKGYLFAGCS